MLVEFGPLVLDIALRLRAQLVMERLRAEGLAGIIDLVPGIRSLLVHYDRDVLALATLMAALERIEAAVADVSHVRVPSRIVHLPLSWDDEQARLAMTRYQELVRPDAPWCPSNIEFIRRINGLDDIEAVKADHLRRPLSGSGSGRCLSGGAGGDAARSRATGW